jgi:hypothetical protein
MVSHSNPRAALAVGTLAAAALAALAGCRSLDVRPAEPTSGLSGQWQRDAAASDDFDHKLTALLDTLRRRTGPRHGAFSSTAAGGSGGGGGRRGGGRSGGSEDADAAGGSGETESDALGVPLEEPDKARARLADELRPPAALRIAMDGAAVQITGDAEPMRQFFPGTSVSRIDASGAASLTSGWQKNVFVVSARYTDKATRSWHYELERASGLLRVSFDANDPEFGHLTLLTRYRRSASER